jgi:hypothetical protein
VNQAQFAFLLRVVAVVLLVLGAAEVAGWWWADAPDPAAGWGLALLGVAAYVTSTVGWRWP